MVWVLGLEYITEATDFDRWKKAEANRSAGTLNF